MPSRCTGIKTELELKRLPEVARPCRLPRAAHLIHAQVEQAPLGRLRCGLRLGAALAAIIRRGRSAALALRGIPGARLAVPRVAAGRAAALGGRRRAPARRAGTGSGRRRALPGRRARVVVDEEGAPAGVLARLRGRRGRAPDRASHALSRL